jgi:hypothetical protein
MSIITSVDLHTTQDTPTCTVAMPVAILTEPPKQVMHVVEELTRSAMTVGSIQIILWCNATDVNQKTASQCFQRLLRAAQQTKQSPIIGLRLVLDILPNRFPPTAIGQVKKIKQVRTNYMRTIIDEWHHGRIGADHPVLWFDADTTFIDPVVIPKMLHALRNDKAYFVKGRMVYTGNTEDVKVIASSVPAERVAIIYATLRALLEDTLGPYDPREYVDECGLAFKLSTYVMAGGLARSRGPVQGESRVLLRRAKAKLRTGIPLLIYISSASHGTHYRRFQALAQYVRPDKIPEQNGELYFLSSSVVHPGCNVIPIRKVEVLLMVETMLRQHVILHNKQPLLPPQLKIVNDLVQQAFPEEVRQ